MSIMINQVVNAAKQAAYQAGMSRRRLLGWLGKRALGAAAKAPRPTVRLWLEPLECRLCPSWSTPVNLGPVVNFPGYSQRQMAISPDGLSLYFSSNRLEGSFGATDLWVSHRVSPDDAWGEPQNLGPNINSAGNEYGPDFSADGHWLFFESINRPDGYGGGDIYASYRQDTHDDFGWQPAVNLGPGVNSTYDEGDPSIFQDPQTGTTTLYFASFNRPEGMGDWDIYASTLQEDGTFGPAVPVSELNTPYRETHPNVSRDGLTLYFSSTRPGSVNESIDIWESTRATTHDRWSPPVNLGSSINTEFDDVSPYLSDDGNTLFFSSTRPGGANFEIYMSTYSDVYTVTNLADSGAGSLRQAILEANAHHGPDTIYFAPGLQGTITLTSGQLDITDDLDIEGPGADQLAISGNHQSRVFNISGGATVTIAGLTISDGLAFQMGAMGQGGAIRNVSSTLTVANDIFSNNEARGVGAQAHGGAIANTSGASLTVRDTQFIENQAHAVRMGSSTAGAGGSAGAIQSIQGSTLIVTHSYFSHNQAIGDNQASAAAIDCTGSATVTDSTFIGNQCIGGSIGQLGFSRGGAIYNSVGTLTVVNSTFLGNQAIGGSGNSGSGSTIGVGFGGAIANTEGGILFISGSTFTGNQVLGGSNNTATIASLGDLGVAEGGALFNGNVATITDSIFDHNEAIGGSGNMGGPGFSRVGTSTGGGIASEPTPGEEAILTVSNVTLRHNRAVGGAGNLAGTLLGIGIGGGLANEGAIPIDSASGIGLGGTGTVSNSTITDNEALGCLGGAGGNGGDGLGGGLANIFGAILTVSGSTLTGNQALGGAGGAGGNGGSGLGGGLFNDRPSINPTNPGAPTVLTVLGSTITDNEARGGAAGAGGSSAGLGAGGGIASASILTILGSSLTHNWAIGHDGEGGADGGDALGGGLYIAGGTASLLTTIIDYNRALGGDGDTGSNGGNALGGGVYVAAGTVVVSASDISDNQAIGGLGDSAGTDGLGMGGGVYNLGTFVRDATTVIHHNRASDSDNDCFGC
jgi:hypothetical protein